MISLFAFLSGGLFGVGLIISGMTDANKVINFLDLSDAWDPTLAFVMVGGIGIHLALFKFISTKDKPLFEARFFLPTSQDLDKKLILGAVLFGIGWGLGGYCPGPALVSLASGVQEPLAFSGAMLLGMLIKQIGFTEKEKAAD